MALFSVLNDRYPGTCAGGFAQETSELPDGGRLEQRRHFQLLPEVLMDGREHFRRRARVAAQLAETVLDPTRSIDSTCRQIAARRASIAFRGATKSVGLCTPVLQLTCNFSAQSDPLCSLPVVFGISIDKHDPARGTLYCARSFRLTKYCSSDSLISAPSRRTTAPMSSPSCGSGSENATACRTGALRMLHQSFIDLTRDRSSRRRD